ncbi:trp operon leader peptide [Streptomyces sp. NPDC048512]|uniref:trp operon leader peptide n=1 Tax=unclassified Streptomyces TaxID=2593676 RepID=UPI000D19896D
MAGAPRSVLLSGHPWPVTAFSERRAEAVHAVARSGASGTVRRMYAPTNQNWWWTAHPAAH